MGNKAFANPGKHHLGYSFGTPPYNNRKYDELRVPFKLVQWKTALILNRRIYIGNVKITKQDGSVHVEPDTMYKSRVNRFDTFTDSGKITVATGDGESIVALVDYADRILQFKESTLHIINAQQKEFLEDSHKHKGVNNIQAVCKTDYGVAWANSHGAYLYDGRRINDLIEKKGKRSIKTSEWTSFASSTLSVGYIPDKRQILFCDSYTSTNGHIYIYDLVTNSWTKGSAKLATDKTNFINTHDGKLAWGENASSVNSIYTWSNDAVASSGLDIKTPDIDFQTPSVKKKINKVYVTYKTNPGDGEAVGIDVKYGVNGGSCTNTFNQSLVDTNGAWSTIGFTPASKPTVSSVYSIQLAFLVNSSTHKDFEINDISIVYRPKSIK